MGTMARWRKKLLSSLPESLPEESPLNLTLFSIDQLTRHARMLVARHKVGEGLHDDLLLPRLANNEQALLSAYEALSGAVPAKRRISPAGEWLLDNFYIIEEQIRTTKRHLPPNYSRELPHLVNAKSLHLPRVYDLALEVIAHVDGRVDEENITAFVAAYQEVTWLKLGELWAIPIMLRLALIENLRRVASRVVVAMDHREQAAYWAQTLIKAAETDPKNLIVIVAEMAKSSPVLSNSFVAEFVRLLQAQGAILDLPLTWMEQQLLATGRSIQEAVETEAQQQAGNQVSVGASIGSLRFLEATDWREFVEKMSPVERELREDPAQVYALMDFTTRDRYRHVVEGLAKRYGLREWEVAKEAVGLSRRASTDASADISHARPNHVGYFLIDRGLKEFKKTLQSSAPALSFTSKILNLVHLPLRVQRTLYGLSIVAVTLWLALHLSWRSGVTVGAAGHVFIGLLTALCASQLALSLTNWVATLLKQPDLLPRMDYSKKIPADRRTLVAIPSMLLNPHHIHELVERLEIHYLANRDAQLHFALLTDFADAPEAVMPSDARLCEVARSGIEALNAKYKSVRGDIFYLLHRPRLWNATENVWMGYERKRGKLSALNEFLRGHPNLDNDSAPLFSVIVGRTEILKDVKYVITLDSDTQLPLNSAQKLIGTMSHPLNEPRLDPHSGRVCGGYGILQPRVAVSLPTARRSWYVRLLAHDPGIDPYTSGVSDVYQDLFSEGSFIGKGIYDVDAFRRSQANAFPENLILSHDLVEGCYSRCGLVTDVLLFENHPSHRGDDVKRRRRWIRGDWQILFWLLPRVPDSHGHWRKNPITFLSKWKIFDNLRRSLVPVSATLLLLVGWKLESHPPVFTLLVVATFILPTLFASFASAVRKPKDEPITYHISSSIQLTLIHLLQSFLDLVFLPYDAYVSFDSVVRSLSRLFVTRNRLLEWRSAAESASPTGLWTFYISMIFAPAWAVTTWIYLGSSGWPTLKPAIPFLVVWILSPAIADLLSRPLSEDEAALTDSQLDYLRRISRKTWRYFETFVGPTDNWLPPDNFQETPTTVIAHRTSPTNIGLSLLANLAATDFGYISARSLVQRTQNTFETLDKMERFRGHFYNWYDTLTLKPLLPLYVSTVDSGNLSAMLLTLAPGLEEMRGQKIIPIQAYEGIQDTLELYLESSGQASPELEALRRELRSPPRTLAGTFVLAHKFSEALTHTATDGKTLGDEETKLWLMALQRQVDDVFVQNFTNYLPWVRSIAFVPPGKGKSPLVDLHQLLDTQSEVPSLRGLIHLAARAIPLVDEILKNPDSPHTELLRLRKDLETMGLMASEQISTINRLVQECADLAAVELDFLYDKTRHLLTIGYNVQEHRRDAGHYDLLASEARLCSFVAIAQGQLPQEHWFALGRLVTTWGHSQTLLSWSGSMFEYLMPMLVMPSFRNTLLDQTCRMVVQRQIEYGKQREVPWGISESGYNVTDANLNYQYRAFGVPGLGFKRGLAEDLVIAPYASVMALMVAPKEACLNMERMSHEGFEGKYGFFEAIDYTPSRLDMGENHAIVKSFMAHHMGMSFLSLGHLLQGQKMQQRFQSEPAFRSAELLLHERIPKTATFYPHSAEVSDARKPPGESESYLRVISTPQTPRPEVQLLSNGRYSVMITNSGGGYSRWKNLSVTRWREDPTCDEWGTFCYVRDVNSGKTWSATYQPTRENADHYEAIFQKARAEFRRSDNELEMHTEIAVSPEDDVELRRYSLTNLSAETRIIEITSYSEVVMVPSASDDAHPTFSNLFMQTEILPEKQAILCKRRPREEDEFTPTMVHLFSPYGPTIGEVSYETSRPHFVGRGRTVAQPQVLDSNAPEALSGAMGSVLDPVVSIRCRIEVKPEQTVKFHFVTGIGETHAAAMALIEKYHDRHLADRVFELAQPHRQVALRQLNITDADAQLFGMLAGSVLYANSARRASSSVLIKNRRGQSALWGYGISGDLPIVLLRLTSESNELIVRQLLQAHEYWSRMGLAVDLIILNEDVAGYRQDAQESLMTQIAISNMSAKINQPGGIFVRRADQVANEDNILIQTLARAVFTDKGGSLANQMDRRGRSTILPSELIATVPKFFAQAGDAAEPIAPMAAQKLNFENEFGGFSSDGKEYLVTTSPNHVTPAPWCNVIANPHFGTVVSESGSAYTWCENAHEFRLTPWKNDAVSDASGEAFYLRDEETGDFWSPTPLPVPAQTPYVTSHGFGYSTFGNISYGIDSKLTTFVAIDAPIKITTLKIRNNSGRTRRLSVTGYCEWVLGELRAKSLLHVMTEVDPMNGAVLARNPYHSEFGARIAFFDVSDKNRTITCDRSEFLGRNGSLAEPESLLRTHLSGRVGTALDACAALQSIVSLADGEEKEVVFILGLARDIDDARTLIHRFGKASSAQQALDEVNAHWRKILGGVQIKTPDAALDVLFNGWLPYQTIASRLWARSGYYQSGGAYGFRDQLQDTMSLLHLKPELLRNHLLLCASHQFPEGDVMHWWHPPAGRGVRTKFSDDYLWLPLAAARYVLGTGDTGVLDVRNYFVEGRQVKPDEEAYMDLPKRSEESATLYAHCARAIRRGMGLGAHGLPLMGCGDWNDGMNLVGIHGQGESVWLAFFQFEVLTQFSKIAQLYGDTEFAELCVAHAKKLQENIEANAWDGEWYRRAYFDNGQVLGSSTNEECQIDALPQSWAILSGAGNPERSKLAMQMVGKRLVDRENKIIKLFDPPFDKSDLNPGYIKGYVPGVRENGGQYTHSAIWTAMAFATMGDTESAWDLVRMMNPLRHAATPESLATYKVEPYVVAADVYAVSPHAGRGGWTWYTGSAGWMYRMILETLLGLRIAVDKLHFDPRVPKDWKEFEISYRFRNTTYDIKIKPGASSGTTQVLVDGLMQSDPWLQLVDDEKPHKVEVLG